MADFVDSIIIDLNKMDTDNTNTEFNISFDIFDNAEDFTHTDTLNDGVTENSNRADDSGDRSILLSYIKENRPKNTVYKTNETYKKFSNFLIRKGITVDIVSIGTSEMDKYIGEWLMNLKKNDGTDFEPGSIIVYHAALDRYLRENGYQHSILRSDLFILSRNVLKTKCELLKKSGKGNIPNASCPLEENEIEIFWKNGTFGVNNPDSLLNTIWWVIGSGFCLRGRSEHHQLKVDSFSLHVDEQGTEYLVFREGLTKTRRGEKHQGARKFIPRLYATGGDRCPIFIYKEFMKRRPAETKVQNAPFYIQIKRNRKANDDIWFKNQPLGVNSLSKILPNMAKDNNLDPQRKITNHSQRKTYCTNLVTKGPQVGIDPQLAIQMTGHKNVESLNKYAIASLDQRKVMQDVALNSNTNVQNTSVNSLVEKDPMKYFSFSANCSFANCNFTISHGQ